MQLLKNFNKMKYLSFVSFCVSFFFAAEISAQELNCNISINSSKIQGTNKDVFNTLRSAMSDFMNNTTWTNNVFESNERIDCSILLTITDNSSGDIYKGTLQLQARRPVFGSSYNSVMLNYMDNDIQFKYTEFDALEFSENGNISNLSSLLAYYAYIVIGFDYDSYSLKGGTPYFQKCDKIVNNCQNASDPGWKAFESRARRNRYWLVNNILSEDYSPLRTFMYNYHRLGLDVLDQNIEKGRGVVKDAVLELEKFIDAKPDPFLFYFQVILDAKSDEIVQIFSQALPEDKKRIFDIMVKADPSNPAKYAPLKQ
jgi:hypothetical protein